MYIDTISIYRSYIYNSYNSNSVQPIGCHRQSHGTGGTTMPSTVAT